jgi:hypothetical protein
VKNRQILLTYDVELYFGKDSGTAQECIIVPLRALLDVFKKNRVRATFFIDTIYLQLLKENEKERNNYQKIVEILQEFVSIGCSLELHLHPHWLDAEYQQSGRWVFNSYKNFSLCTLSSDKILDLFLSGVGCIEEIARPVDSNYKVRAFRAGGWQIEPFEIIRHALDKTSIYIDSSVASGVCIVGEIHDSDFRMFPDFSAYRFSESPKFEDSGGKYIEIPISTFHYSFPIRLYKKIAARIWKGTLVPMGKGVGLGCRFICKDHYRLMISTDNYFPPHLFALALHRNNNDAVVVISHPKSISKASLQCVENLRDYEMLTLSEYAQRKFHAH